MSRVYIENERKTEVGGSTHTPKQRGLYLDQIQKNVLSDPHYVPVNARLKLPPFLGRIPFSVPEQTKPISLRVYFDQANLRLHRHDVKWRVRRDAGNGYKQCVKIGGDVNSRREIEHPVESLSPDLNVFNVEERTAIEQAIGKPLGALELFPMALHGTQGWTYRYTLKNNHSAVIELKNDRGSIVTAFDELLGEGPIDIFEVEQELKKGSADLDAERKYLISQFNEKAKREILRPTDKSKAALAFERAHSLLWDNKRSKEIRAAVKEILRGADSEKFMEECVIKPLQFPAFEKAA